MKPYLVLIYFYTFLPCLAVCDQLAEVLLQLVESITGSSPTDILTAEKIVSALIGLLFINMHN